jgi:hypothetical protein
LCPDLTHLLQENADVRLPTLNPSRRRARHGEAFVRSCTFPAHLSKALASEDPAVPWEPVEQGLREWFVCCAHRRKHPLAMPSRLVDEAWHRFILDTVAYTDFCERAYGRRLNHFPEDWMSRFDEPRLSKFETVWAWDRSDWSREGEATLWTLDQGLGAVDPWGMSHRDLHEARTRPAKPGWEKETHISGASSGGDDGVA